ncbi:MAG: hypothetical protein H7039_07785 [Bryobacteraceae bacterium]|nr:hypothetical protein [Bryobacteraceae bacterium]
MRSLAVLVLLASPIAAQQPFYTDDADVTERGKFHLEVSNQYAWLGSSAFPTLRQNAVIYQLNYGLWNGLELGVDSPLIVLFNDKGTNPRRPFGNGDTNFTLKWNFRPEVAESRWPALTVSFAVETPTGDAASQLGSGVADYGFNTVVQKTIGENVVFRLNNGLIFSGNTLTGVVGLRAQGVVYTGGSSVTRRMTRNLLLGIEINGAAAQSSSLGKGAMQAQVGGKLAVFDNLTLDFGILAGRLEGSSRAGLLIGISKDF